jgi:hypothetical protein
LAERGKQFSEIETLLYLYYVTLKQLRRMKSGEKTAGEKLLEGMPGFDEQYRAEIPKLLQNFAFQISQILIDAITAFDSVKIIEIADAVKYLKTSKPVADPWRSKILMEKDLLIKWGKEWEIGEWARILDWTAEDKKSGFPQLRRLLKEFEAPLKPLR